MLKAGVKDVIARLGQEATFSGKPWGDEGGSGFHLHMSLVNANGDNLMHDGAQLSTLAKQMIAGIVHHAAALTAFCNPTINAFKRLGPDTLAPYRANWGHDNRSAMLRVPPERGGGTRLEMRLGDGAANAYIMTAALLAAGLDGIRRELECPPPAVGYSYEDESQAILPMDLGAALDALRADEELVALLGGPLVDVFEVMKRDEIERYTAAVDDPSTRDVTEWEVREYFLLFHPRRQEHHDDPGRLRSRPDESGRRGADPRGLDPVGGRAQCGDLRPACRPAAPRDRGTPRGTHPLRRQSGPRNAAGGGRARAAPRPPRHFSGP
jgi:glutamine synthetase